jgi:DNA-directed RNA polymerase specialized sigma24 family protein
MERGDKHQWPHTQWTQQVEEAQRGSAEALAALCVAYHYPIYAFFRRRGSSEDGARDLTQGLFAKLVREGGIRGADRSKGSFRSYLCGAASHLERDEWRAARAEKRGGGAEHVSIEAAAAEARYEMEPAHHLTPERIFDRAWAIGVVERALGELRDEDERHREKQKLRGKVSRRPPFDTLRAVAANESEAKRHTIAGDLGMTVDDFNHYLDRFRERLHAALKREVAPTVSSPDEIEEELRFLLQALDQR